MFFFTKTKFIKKKSKDVLYSKYTLTLFNYLYVFNNVV